MLFNLVVGLIVGISVNIIYNFLVPKALLSICEAGDQHGTSSNGPGSTSRSNTPGSGGHLAYIRTLFITSVGTILALLIASFSYIRYDVDRLGPSEIRSLCAEY